MARNPVTYLIVCKIPRVGKICFDRLDSTWFVWRKDGSNVISGADAIRDIIRAIARGNQSEFARLLGVNSRTIRRWVSGEKRPSLESLYKIAELKIERKA